MIEIISGNAAATEIVAAAFRRSCGSKSVRVLEDLLPNPGSIVVIVDPIAVRADFLEHILAVGKTKIILFGSSGKKLDHCGLYQRPISADLKQSAHCFPAEVHAFAESSAGVVYHRSIAGEEIPLRRRAFLRYDFSDEWNNLGYGAIRADGSIWSIASQATLDGWVELSSVELAGQYASAWSALREFKGSSLLWFNRPVGPVDSAEWFHVEAFLSGHQFGQLPCQPVIEQVPFGFDSAVTMRLDCDEGVESARNLFELYQKEDVPFSLAIVDHLLTDERNHLLPHEILSGGGSLLSHSSQHRPDWGGAYNEAFTEAKDSARKISRAFGIDIETAVSPFHQTPSYARDALSDAGYFACVGGIIKNDPDFLMARAGYPPNNREDLIGHSQQCMLHGDCLVGDDPISVFKAAFDIAKNSKTFFGYLDHPFSARYSYGWLNEADRFSAHHDFISYMRASGKNLFANENDALRFLRSCARVSIQEEKGFIRFSQQILPKWPISILYGHTRSELYRDLELKVFA